MGEFVIKSPIDPFIKQKGVLILDGGLATELENRGHDLNHPLWSARLLINNPDEIYAVHRTYLEAGADCIISASYQASLAGFISEGLSEKAAKDLIKNTITIACNARDDFYSTKNEDRLKPLVAASIGPYGAYLADGSEYRGDYTLSHEDLIDFHLPRWELLTQTSADLIACETIPSIREAEVIKRLIESTQNVHVWICFSCKEGNNISDGTPIEECVALFEDCPQVVAIGINCTAPNYILPLIKRIVRCVTSKHIVVYPNSGELYDSKNKVWRGTNSAHNFSTSALEWYKAGARLIGGCCRTSPDHISSIRKILISKK